MPPLPSDLRRVLENAVIAAREEATTAAGAALKRLAVEAKDFPPYLTPDERVLRLKLRAAARQLGDPWNADKQAFATLNKLTHEVAYEHWHRMLFARFLAENNLLIHPEHNVPVDLATVAELAQEEAAKSGTKADTWATAGRFAATMLPQIFRQDDPALAVLLAPEHQQALERILESLPPSVFTADDSLGWVYQFWQSAEKERVNAGVKGGDKITGETLPAVTQLFTEHYMVLFLLHNTVGAWHAAKHMAKWSNERMAKCQTEADCRAAVALPGYSFDYLRFVKNDDTGAWRPAAGTFAGWPTRAAELKVLDPCCGSGHFLVAALELLTRLRMAEERLEAKAAALAVIADNLFGLELDARCTQIAAFNVAFAAWKLAGVGGEHFAISELHIACAGLAPNCSQAQWLKLADTRMSMGRRSASPTHALLPTHGREAVKNTLRDMHDLFSKAPELGSLIDPTATAGTLGSADWETVKPFLTDVLAEESKGGDADALERAVAAQGMAKAAEILSGEYTLVITNVPYLARKSHAAGLASWAISSFPHAKGDLATLMISRAQRLLAPGGALGVVSPQNWMLQATYRTFRRQLLDDQSFALIARLGSGAFETIGGEVVNVVLTVSCAIRRTPETQFAAIDLSSVPTVARKAHLLRGDGRLTSIRQADIVSAPDSQFAFEPPTKLPLLGDFVDVYSGICLGDDSQFRRDFWELTSLGREWQFLQSAPQRTALHGETDGMSSVVLWENGKGTYHAYVAARLGANGMSAWIRGLEARGQRGVAISRMAKLPCTHYTGALFDQGCAVLIPKVSTHLPAIQRFCSSQLFHDLARKVDQRLCVWTGSLANVQFDLTRWDADHETEAVAASRVSTEWLYHGNPGGSDPASALQTTVARLVGYRWPAELDEKMRLAPEARAWADKCKDLESHADDDGVVPLVNINKERPGHERVRALLEAAFGAKWTPGLLNDLLAAAGAPGKSLDDWLKHEFWAQHCAVFHHRPFVWQIWDGKKDGFNILVHYHRLAEGSGKGEKLLQKITYTYLGDWITQQQAAAKQGVAGADTRLKAAQDLQKKLEAILAGEPPYDIFVRWKPLHEQPIGWNPDINDGVRMNIRPFVTAGVLRGKVNVKWTKDRGKEPESIRPKAQFPWFWSCPEDEPPVDFAGGDKFTGERLNDLHYTRKAKEAAQERSGKGQAK